MKLGVFIQSASSAGMGEGGSRYGGTVQFVVLTPDEERSRLVERFEYSMSQDEFVRMIIEGAVGDFAERLSTHI